jgi:hypothetical protein
MPLEFLLQVGWQWMVTDKKRSWCLWVGLRRRIGLLVLMQQTTQSQPGTAAREDLCMFTRLQFLRFIHFHSAVLCQPCLFLISPDILTLPISLFSHSKGTWSLLVN